MKVLMIGPYPSPGNAPKGGVEAVVFNLSNGLADAGIELRVLSFTSELSGPARLSLARTAEVRYVRTSSMNNKRRFYAGEGRKILSGEVKEFNPHIIHFQGNGPHLLLTKLLEKSSVIITQHGNILREMMNQQQFKSKLIYLTNALIEKIFSRSVRNYIFISKYNKDLLGKNFLSHAKHDLIYNAVNPDFFKIQGRPEIHDTILFIGGIRKAKGLLDLVTSIHSLKEKGVKYRLNVVGDNTEPAYRELINSYIWEHGLEKEIVFMGQKTQEEIVKLYESVSVMVLPSYQECLPMSIAEAMAAERTVISTNVGGVPEMIVENETGFMYEKGNTEELQTILEKLHRQPQLLEKTGRSARLAAMHKYHPDVIVAKTIQFYKDVAGGKN